MAHNPTAMGILVHTDLAKASAELRRLFVEHKTIAAISKHLGVDRHTIQRWIVKIQAAGHSDPRVAVAVSKRAAGDPKPAPKKKTHRS